MPSSAATPGARRFGAWLIYLAVMVTIIGGLYLASERIEYDWRWRQVPQYLISNQGHERLAPFDGFVALAPDGQSLTLKELKGSRSVRIGDYDELLVGDGDLVFADDPLARKHGLVAGPLAVGLWLTLKISALSLLLALALGLLIGLGRVSRHPAVHGLATTYVEIIRGTPLLVQIFIFYFFVGTVLELSAFAAGVAALAVFTAAYVAEIVRAGIEAVPRGQMEAARSLGLSVPQAMRHVILPQALKRSLPPLAGQFINLVKDSSLVSVMALTDLTKAGREVVSSSFSPFEVWFTVAAMYLLLTASLSYLVRRLEKRLAHD